MPPYSINNPFPVILNQIGGGLNGGKVYIGVAGQDPQTSPTTVYWDEAGTVVASQPLDTIGGYITRNGTPATVYIPVLTYSIRVRDRFGAQVYYSAEVNDPIATLDAAKANTALNNLTAGIKRIDPSFEGGDPGLIIEPLTIYNDTPTTTDVADLTILRREPTGGVASFTSNALRVIMETVAGSLNFAWAALFKLDNYANAGENNAAYFQGIKRSTGATWAYTAEAIDATSLANPASGLLGAEIDIRANGTDSLNQRVAVDIVATRQYVSGAPSGAAMECGAGIRLQNGGDASATFNFGIWFYPGTRVKIGIDFSTATIIGQAVKFGAGQAIGWSNTPAVQSLYDAVAVGLVDQVGAVTIHARYDNGVTYQKPLTFAGLPPAGLFGRRAAITDCNTAVFNAVAAGGGANKVWVQDDGAAWRVG